MSFDLPVDSGFVILRTQDNLFLTAACRDWECKAMHERVTITATETIAEVRDSTANPAPLGLLGFGMTTVLLNLHNAGYFGMSTMILSMGVMYGGLAQIFAGWMEW